MERQALKLSGRSEPKNELRLNDELKAIATSLAEFAAKFDDEPVLQVWLLVVALFPPVADCTPSLQVKDIGPQFSYRGVFIIEYLGPILIMAFVAMRPAFLFGSEALNTPLSSTASCVMLSFYHACRTVCSVVGAVQAGRMAVDRAFREA